MCTGIAGRPWRLVHNVDVNVLDDSEIKRVLTVSAHPDDVDFGSAGSIAAWTDRGIEVTYLMVTDGDAGDDFGKDGDRATDNGGMAEQRRVEQAAAAKAVGVSDVRHLGYPDGRVEATLGLRRDIARVIRDVRPDRVLTHSPERNYVRIAPSHPDHRAVGSATLDAVYPDARNPYTFPEIAHLEAWTVREVWLSGGPAPNHYVDMTANFDRKVAALRAHQSQTSHLDRLEEFVRQWLSANANVAGFPVGTLAESFQVVPTS